MKSLAKKEMEVNLDSVKNVEEKSRKKKKDKEQKKPKSNGIQSPTQEAKHRKETKEEPENNTGKIIIVHSLSAECRKQKHDMKVKEPKGTPMSAKASRAKPSGGTTKKKSVKRGNISSMSEQEKNKRPKESGTHEKLKPNSPNSKVEASAKKHDSFSEKAASSRNKGQTQIATQIKPRPSFVSLTSLVEKSREPNVRRLKIMRALGLSPPAASPFIRAGPRL